MKYNTNYRHRYLYPDSTFDSRHSGRFTVLGKLQGHNRRGYYAVRFEESGIVKAAYGSHIKTGCVSDDLPDTSLFTRKYFGVGYIGDGPFSTYDSVVDNVRTRMFILWVNMLARCYSVKDGKQRHTGYRGVVVCEEWHNYQNFCNDLPSVHGYSKWLNNPGCYELDKDYLCERIYSPDTVCFVTTEDNAREAGIRSRSLRVDNYDTINNRRDEILSDAVEALYDADITHEVKLIAVTHIISIPTPYGIVVYYPLTQKIQRFTKVHDGDVNKLIEYVQWLRNQWEYRNPVIDCIEV